MFKDLEDIIKRVEARIAALFESGDTEHAADLQEVVGAAKKHMATADAALEPAGNDTIAAAPAPAVSLAASDGVQVRDPVPSAPSGSVG